MNFNTLIDGQQYDITQFMNKHPGGKDFLMLAVNRDATVLFHSYHRKLDLAKLKLSSLPKLSGAQTIKSASYSLASPFYKRIRQAVNSYFDANKLSSRGGSWMLLKSILLILLTALTYYLVVFRGLFWFAPLFGVLLAVNGEYYFEMRTGIITARLDTSNNNWITATITAR